MAVVGQRLGLFEQFAEPARAKQTLLGLGGWGYVVFIVAYAALQPFGVPGTVFIMAAPLVWPWPVAFVLSMIGTMCATVVGFSFARFVARDWVASKIPQRFKRYDDALERRALLTVFVLRLIFWMPPLLHAFFGVSKVKFSTHFWGSFAGYLLPLFLVSFAGKKLFELLERAPPGAWVALGVAVASIWVTAYFLRRRSARALRGAER
ncbi:MAG: TVP38/TMEM64 family protein [Myxococcales bacterium]|nr:TVP38/TMEM64 family protein [Myxococcales bacterium]